MCLSRLATFEHGDTGYKVVKKMRRNKFKPLIFPYDVKPLVKGEWIEDTNRDSIGLGELTSNVLRHEKYPCGFHIYLDLKIALSRSLGFEKRVVVKVQFKEVVAAGYEKRNGQMVVARQIKILEEVKV